MATNIPSQLTPWYCLADMHPVEVAGVTRYPAIAWQTADGSSYQMRGTITFDRFENFSKCRFFIVGCTVQRGDDGEEVWSLPTELEIRLPTKKMWTTQAVKVKGKTSKGRSIVLTWDTTDAEVNDPTVLVGVEVIVPIANNSDKGKELELAVAWAKAAVLANMAWIKLRDIRAPGCTGELTMNP